ncbi:putative ribonuclease H-like domain-containing protein [Tanacetum coccineum]
MVRNKARLVAQGYTQEEGIDYDELFAPIARIEEIRLFLAYASFMGFIVYQMDVKSAFLYGTIEEEVYVCQPPSFEDLQFPDKVYKIEKALYGLHQAPRAWSKKDDGIFLNQDKYVADILKKFDFATVKTVSTPIETNKALLKDEKAEDVDVHLYRSMIGSLMYLTASRPDIMFAVYACTRFQVTPKVSHLHAVKRIFRYLKGQPKLGIWYPRDSPFNLEAFLDSDYARASIDRKSTTEGCKFLVKRLISWQCKKQTIIANSTTKAEFVVAANCYGQEWEDRMERANTIASSLVAKQDSGNINRTQSMAIINESFPQGTYSVSAVRLNLPLLVLVYAARHTLTAIRRKLMLSGITCYYWFWASAKAKIVKWERQIQALVDKQVIITETSIRSDLKLDDAEGIDCLPTTTIFCRTGKNGHLEGGVKFLMYPRKGFFGRVTPLFPTMMIQASEDMGEDSTAPSDSYSTPIISQPSSSKPKKKKSRRKQRKDISPTEPVTAEAHVSTPSYNPSESEKVLDLEKPKSAQAKEIASLNKRAKQLEKRRKLRTIRLKRLRKVGSTSRVESSNDVSLGAQEDASKQRKKIADLDADAEVTLVDETQEMNDDNLMFDTGVLEEQEIEFEKVVEEPIVSVATTTKSIPVSADDPEEQVFASTKTFSSSQSQLPQVKDKGKGKMVEPERPLKKKDQVALDEEMDRNLKAQMQAELIEEERLARQKEEQANIALIES